MATCCADDSVWENAIRFLNTEFQDNPKLLRKAPDIYNEVKHAKTALENQLSFATSEAPSKIETAVKEAEHTTSQITNFMEQTEVLCGDIANHKADVIPLVKKLSALTSQMKEVDKYSKYLQLISRIEDFSSDVQSALLINAVDRAVGQFFELAELVERLQRSDCKHLVSFANDTVIFWYNILKDKFSKEFDEVLQAWHWPFISSTTKLTPVQNAAEVRERLEPLFYNLLHLQLPDGLSHLVQKPNPFLENVPGWHPLLLPIQLMVKPLRKRFLYHFYGNKKTNSLDKPHWYLSQTLSWIRDHRDFLHTKIQPLLEKQGLGNIDAVMEFSRGLVILVIEKLMNDINKLIFDDDLFSNMVNQVLTFDKELRIVYNYPPSQLGCLHVLSQPQPFKKWISIERKVAQEKLDALFSSPMVWQSQYKDLSDVDEMKVPECGEAFVTLMLTITERYKPLPSPQLRLEFLDFQLELLEDFRYRLIQMKTGASQDPLGSTYAAILNTVNFVTDVLGQWSELGFFLELQFFKKIQTKQANGLGPSGEVSDGKDDIIQSFDYAMTAEDVNERNLEALENSVFDEITDLLERVKNEMIMNIAFYIADDVKARSRSYRNDRWVGMPSPKEIVSPALSTTACEMMLVLRERLQHVEQLLAKQLFISVWQKVAEVLNTFFYEEVILENSFNEGGAFQIHFDMTRNLFPLFGQYTQNPEAYFKDVKEACQVLMMKTGSALLLKELLYCALHDPKSDPNDMPSDPVAALQEQGIYKLLPEQVELLLRRRLDLT